MENKINKITQRIKNHFLKNNDNEANNDVKEQSEEKIFFNSERTWLNVDKIYITDKIYIRIPTVGEVLKDENTYYSITSSLTSTAFQFMVQLDDMGLDYTKVTDYELFLILFPIYAQSDMSLLFGDLDTSDFEIYTDKNGGLPFLYSPKNDITIDELIYNDIANVIRKINSYEKVKSKAGNESAKKYLLEKERRKQKRNKNKKKDSYLEKLVIALVNTDDFPYDYNTCMNLSIYNFNQSFKQIQQRITFDNTMIGVYAGTVDTSKMSNKDALSWIVTNK